MNLVIILSSSVSLEGSSRSTWEFEYNISTTRFAWKIVFLQSIDLKEISFFHFFEKNKKLSFTYVLCSKLRFSLFNNSAEIVDKSYSPTSFIMAILICSFFGKSANYHVTTTWVILQGSWYSYTGSIYCQIEEINCLFSIS